MSESRLKYKTIANQTKENGKDKTSVEFGADWRSKVNYFESKICNALKNARPQLQIAR